MTIQHRLIAFGIAIAGGTAEAIWGKSLLLDIATGIAVICIALSFLDSGRRAPIR